MLCGDGGLGGIIFRFEASSGFRGTWRRLKHPNPLWDPAFVDRLHHADIPHSRANVRFGAITIE